MQQNRAWDGLGERQFEFVQVRSILGFLLPVSDALRNSTLVNGNQGQGAGPPRLFGGKYQSNLFMQPQKTAADFTFLTGQQKAGVPVMG